jgi:hypothetical protein
MLWSAACSTLILSMLVVWFVLTVLNQYRNGKWIRRIKRYDVLAVIPIWTFFAPSPGCTDQHLLYRDCDAEGNLSVWRDIELKPYIPLRFVWHPYRRISKAVTDQIPIMTRPNREGEQGYNKARMLEVPYIMILYFVSTMPKDFLTHRRQFLIAQTNGVGSEGKPEILYISSLHDL